MKQETPRLVPNLVQQDQIPHSPNADNAATQLAALFEERLGAIMLLRLELTELLQRLTSEEHELAASLRTVLRVRDQERSAMATKLHAANMRALAAEKRLERYKKRHADDNDDDDDDDPDYYDGDLADDELLQRYADSVQSGSEHASCTPTVTGTEAGEWKRKAWK